MIWQSLSASRPDNLLWLHGVLHAERQPVHQHLTLQLPAPFVMSTPVITAGGPGGSRSSRFPFQAHSSRNVSRRACTRTTDRHPGRQIPPGIYRQNGRAHSSRNVSRRACIPGLLTAIQGGRYHPGFIVEEEPHLIPGIQALPHLRADAFLFLRLVPRCLIVL